MTSLKSESSWRKHAVHCCHNNRILLTTLALIVFVQAITYVASEPFFNNDETRHMTTGVFFRDLLTDFPAENIRDYTVKHYVQYPALGLLIWPPLFHFVEGLLMLVFGINLLVGKLLVMFFSLVASLYLFRLVCYTHDQRTATIATLLFAFSPMVFVYSQQVMLEMPTLAWAMMSVFYFVKYVNTTKPVHVILAGLAAAAAALTRFDAVYLLMFFGVSVLATRKWNLLLRPAAIGAALLAVALVAPSYWLIAQEVGSLHLRQATESLQPDALNYLSLQRWCYYLLKLPKLCGWFIIVPALIGIATSLVKRRKLDWPYFAIILATYLTFTMFAELDTRHAIYWTPAFALFAANGLNSVSKIGRTLKLQIIIESAAVVGSIALAMFSGRLSMQGYGDAVQYVMSQHDEDKVYLFDGWLEGAFIYQVRLQDTARAVWVLRGDKFFYSYLQSPETSYRQYVKSESEIMEKLFELNPSFVIVEQPDPRSDVPLSDVIRMTLRNHPERFRFERSFPVRLTRISPLLGRQQTIQEYGLAVYRNIYRNPNPNKRFEFDLQLWGRKVSSDAPQGEDEIELQDLNPPRSSIAE